LQKANEHTGIQHAELRVLTLTPYLLASKIDILLLLVVEEEAQVPWFTRSL